jgi:ribosomal protein S18 acetylase RimI-like enzyme
MDSKYHVRDYQKGDFHQIKVLWDETGMSGEERADDEGIIEHCNTLGGKFLILLDTELNLIIGTSWMSFDGRRIHLHHFAIKPSYQSMGFGTFLAKESLKYIKEKGYQVKLEVHKSNLIAKRLYEKFGFFAFRDYDIYMIRNVKEL